MGDDDDEQDSSGDEDVVETDFQLPPDGDVFGDLEDGDDDD